MKKFIAIIFVMVTMLFLLAGCGNVSVGLGNYSFKKVHIDTHHYSGCLTVEKWYLDENGIEVLTEEAGSVFLSEGTYIMIGGDKPCPMCQAGKGDSE